MNLCIPATEDRGLQSPVSAHFGSAPLFVIADTETGRLRTVPNRNLDHAHGMCQPLQALAGEGVDGVAVGGIGLGALERLQAGGIRVFLSEEPTVEATLSALKAGVLREATSATACRHHGQGSGRAGGAGPCGGRRLSSP